MLLTCSLRMKMLTKHHQKRCLLEEPVSAQMAHPDCPSHPRLIDRHVTGARRQRQGIFSPHKSRIFPKPGRRSYCYLPSSSDIAFHFFGHDHVLLVCHVLPRRLFDSALTRQHRFGQSDLLFNCQFSYTSHFKLLRFRVDQRCDPILQSHPYARMGCTG